MLTVFTLIVCLWNVFHVYFSFKTSTILWGHSCGRWQVPGCKIDGLHWKICCLFFLPTGFVSVHEKDGFFTNSYYHIIRHENVQRIPWYYRVSKDQICSLSLLRSVQICWLHDIILVVVGEGAVRKVCQNSSQPQPLWYTFVEIFLNFHFHFCINVYYLIPAEFNYLPPDGLIFKK